MSADNYFLVRPHGDKFVVTMEFASCEEPSPIDGTNVPTFDTRLEALDYAHSQWAEYGVVDESNVDPENSEAQSVLSEIVEYINILESRVTDDEARWVIEKILRKTQEISLRN